MKNILIAILFFALGIWVGYVVFHTNTEIAPGETATSTSNGDGGEENSDETDMSYEATTTNEANSTEESITVSPDTLTTEQKELLEKFGIDTNGITITAAMIACAEEKVGMARLEEIKNGSSPTFFESIALVACYK